MDISFALSSDIYLAAVDEGGNLFVYSFTLEGDSVMYPLKQLTSLFWFFFLHFLYKRLVIVKCKEHEIALKVLQLQFIWI